MLRRFVALLGGLGLVAPLLLAACSSEPRREAAPPDAGDKAPADAIEVIFTYGSEKEEWIQELTTAFNRERRTTKGGKVVFVQAIPMGSGECIEELVQETRKAHLTSPASAAFIRLGNAQSRTRTGKDLIPRTENLVLSPVVIAIWRPMAEALGWGKRPVGWSEILTMAREPRGWAAKGFPQWGSFKFGHTHPESSNSGLISLLAEVYAAAGKLRDLTLADVSKPATAEFLATIEGSVVHYGSSTGFFGRRMFESGPAYLSAAVLYENMVIESYSAKYRLPFPVVALYPREGTFWSDHPVGIVQRDWVTAAHREAARLYVDYLLEPTQQAKAIPYGFRPSAVEVPLAAPIDAAHGVDPKEPQTTLEVPPVEVMDAILQLWRRSKRHANVVLVLDTSGSMNAEKGARIENAKAGAKQLIESLGDDDRFSLLLFNQKPTWIREGVPIREARAELLETVGSVYADGGTALYDAIDVAYQRLLSEHDAQAERISAVVVLTDGADTHSQLKLEGLLGRIRFDAETRNIRVFTIAYGDAAEKGVLKKVAEATQARSYEGNPKTIRTVFRDVSMFF